MNDDEKKLWDAIALKMVGSPMVVHELPETIATRIIERRRAFFDQGIGADLTGPKKPTKPFVEPRCDCGRIGAEHIQIENGKGWLHCDGALRLYE
jgi:hypothetical protein